MTFYFVNLGAELIKMFNPGNGIPVSETEELECAG
jgi:hypothetical protein